jgi:hypothetical protein
MVPMNTCRYPSTEKIKIMCVDMIADLWHAGEQIPVGFYVFLGGGGGVKSHADMSTLATVGLPTNREQPHCRKSVHRKGPHQVSIQV